MGVSCASADIAEAEGNTTWGKGESNKLAVDEAIVKAMVTATHEEASLVIGVR